ncbi:MAG: SDR family oxidoreductase [Armatimonadetes bacterium]|nr:SDR family oxidoreductase [Anaerolineae bacterium]
MKIAIFGASGRTGIPLVAQALAAGHSVQALVRTPSKFTIQHPNLTVIQGDVLNTADVARTISGMDAVMSVLAPVKASPNDLLTKAADHILAAMQQHNVKRIIYMTGAGVEMPQDQPKLINHVIKFALKTMAGDVLKQSELAVAKVTKSDREWVIVRGPMLTNSAHTGQYRVGWVGVNTGPRLARANAADFMLKQLSGNQYLGQAPVLSD